MKNKEEVTLRYKALEKQLLSSLEHEDSSEKKKNIVKRLNDLDSAYYLLTKIRLKGMAAPFRMSPWKVILLVLLIVRLLVYFTQK